MGYGEARAPGVNCFSSLNADLGADPGRRDRPRLEGPTQAGETGPGQPMPGNQVARGQYYPPFGHTDLEAIRSSAHGVGARGE